MSFPVSSVAVPVLERETSALIVSDVFAAPFSEEEEPATAARERVSEGTEEKYPIAGRSAVSSAAGSGFLSSGWVTVEFPGLFVSSELSKDPGEDSEIAVSVPSGGV